MLLFSSMFGPLHSITKNTTRRTSAINPVTMENSDNSYYKHIAQCYHESTPCTVSKDKWDTKKDTGKSMKHASFILQRLWYAKNLLG